MFWEGFYKQANPYLKMMLAEQRAAKAAKRLAGASAAQKTTAVNPLSAYAKKQVQGTNLGRPGAPHVTQIKDRI